MYAVYTFPLDGQKEPKKNGRPRGLIKEFLIRCQETVLVRFLPLAV